MNEKFLKRFFEIIPGTLTWLALILPFVLSFSFPVAVAVYAIIFNFYWLYRSLFLTKNLFIVYASIKKQTETNWLKKIEKKENENFIWPNGLSFSDLLHVIVMPQYKESYEVISRSLDSYLKSNFPIKEKMIFLITSEIRKDAQKMNLETFEQLKNQYGHRFYQFMQTFHPPDIPGEIPCKSSNSTWGAKYFKKQYLDKKNIPYAKVVIHNFDTDTQVHPEYFAAVSYQFLMTPKNLPTSYQPIHLYSNNIWHTSAVSRIVATSSTITLMHNSLRPHRFKNFSSRSDCFQTIVDIGYWVVDAIPEDSRQYFDSMYYYCGNFWVQPIYIPLLMDAVFDDDWKKTLITQYRQLRRWAWGIVDFPYTLLKARRDKKIPLVRKIMWSVRLLEGHFSWATAAIHISILGWMPIVLNNNFANSVVGFNLPTITKTVLNLAIVGLLTVVYITLALLPPRPKKIKKIQYFQFIIQWLLFPLVSIFFSSIAAIDAQTRLMFGKYLEYQVTAKAVKKE